MPDRTSVAQALERFLPALEQGGLRLPQETVPLQDALGRVTARPILAGAEMPPFARAHRDGYAVRASDVAMASPETPVRLVLVGEVRMGRGYEGTIRTGECAAIPTGGILPEGADAVVMLEDTEREHERVLVRQAARSGQHVTPRAADTQRGAVLVPAGQRLRPQDIGAAAGTGVLTAEVVARPRVLVLATGDELVPPDRTPGPGQIREFNSWSLAAALREDGAIPLVHDVIPDRLEDLLAATDHGLAEADAILFIGGSSVGARDFTARVIERRNGPGILVQGLALQPGRPTIMALLEGRGGLKPTYGLPGHPVSCLVVYEAVVRPVLRALQGLPPQMPAVGLRARLAVDVTAPPNVTFVYRVRLSQREDGWWAEPVPGDSAILTSMVHADGYLLLAPGSRLAAGTEVLVRPFAGGRLF